MRASQPLKLVSDVGSVSSANATSAVSSAQIVRSGVVHVTASSDKASGSIAACNTSTQTGVGSMFVDKGSDILYRYAHPANANVTNITAANPAVITLDHPDTKISVGDYVTLVGSTVGGYNTQIAHVEVTAKSQPQQFNEYIQTITVNADCSSLAAFSGTATAYKSVIFRLAPETSSGCTLHIKEVGIG